MLLRLISSALLVGALLPTANAGEGVHGTVTYTGDVPPPETRDLSADPVCEHHPKAVVDIQRVLVGEGGGLKDVFVWVSGNVPDERFKAPDEPVVLDQVGCDYEPHVFGVMRRQDIEIRNSDETLHNIHAVPDVNKEFNVGMPTQGMTTTKDFKRAEEAIRIKCDVHPWMLTWCFVMEHPFYGTTDENGSFMIADLPDGEYEITAWHETLGRRTGTVTVADGHGEFNVDFATES